MCLPIGLFRHVYIYCVAISIKCLAFEFNLEKIWFLAVLLAANYNNYFHYFKLIRIGSMKWRTIAYITLANWQISMETGSNAEIHQSYLDDEIAFILTRERTFPPAHPPFQQCHSQPTYCFTHLLAHSRKWYDFTICHVIWHIVCVCVCVPNVICNSTMPTEWSRIYIYAYNQLVCVCDLYTSVGCCCCWRCLHCDFWLITHSCVYHGNDVKRTEEAWRRLWIDKFVHLIFDDCGHFVLPLYAAEWV